MKVPSLGSFIEEVQRLQLLKRDQASALLKNLRWHCTHARDLAQMLLQRGWLTAYQVNLLLAGRGSELALGPYRLLARLGKGGMGAVYKAYHVRMERFVALKVIAKDRLTNEKAIKRFFQEARAAGQLAHPNIVLAYDADQIGDTHFFAMEFVDGTDLAKLVRDSGPLPIQQACAYIQQAAAGLAHAHARAVVHRDIKPSNLLVTRTLPGEPELVKVLDFGLARWAGEGEQKSRITAVNIVFGTVDFLSPEQAEDPRQADHRSDLYSLGCTLSFLLTGQPPFTGDDVLQRLSARLLGEAPSVRAQRPEVPPALDRVVATMMARQPANRYQNAEEVIAALLPYVQPAQAKPGAPAEEKAPMVVYNCPECNSSLVADPGDHPLVVCPCCHQPLELQVQPRSEAKGRRKPTRSEPYPDPFELSWHPQALAKKSKKVKTWACPNCGQVTLRRARIPADSTACPRCGYDTEKVSSKGQAMIHERPVCKEDNKVYFHCTGCGKHLRAKREYAGKKATCTGCGKRLRVPKVAEGKER